MSEKSKESLKICNENINTIEEETKAYRIAMYGCINEYMSLGLHFYTLLVQQGLPVIYLFIKKHYTISK
jgi:hypothetical protein